jgi:alpha-glucosidase (family GH31 glycosyl hydrolase)
MDMPYGKQEFFADLGTDLKGNQGCPLLISNKGRFIWSDGPFSFHFKEDGSLVIEGDSEIVTGDGYTSLRNVYKHVSGKFFPASGTYPDELLFTAPQYNLWIELLYEPTQEKVLDYARNVLKNGMAPGVIMIDDNWHEPYGTWKFHSGRFPDPKSMTDELHELGFKVMLWMCPFVSADSFTFRQLESKGMFLKDQHGDIVIRRWWNGYSAILDFTNPDAVDWFYEQTEELQQRYGIDGFKLDAGDLAFYSSGDVSARSAATPNDHCEAWAKVGLRYPLNEYRACWKLGGQPLAQRLRDKNHSWDGNGLQALIPDALSQGLMGYSYTCPDMIGGGEYVHFTAHAHNLDGELFVRYAQCSALFPMMQFSAAPWRLLNDEHFHLCKQAAQLHVDTGEKILRLVRESARTGEPILRHLEYEYPGLGYENVTDQFLLGSDILVAPVITKGAVRRSISFPPGTWVGDDQSIVEGPCILEVDAPLSRLPWYRRQRSD